VGYEEGGQLTEAVRRKPYSVVLLDEIEKAHPEVFNILLQMLDDGRLTDNKGRTVSFKNTIIIMTSNLGAQFIRESSEKWTDADADKVYGDIRTNVMEMLKQTLRPEFINRIDDIIVFHPLTKNNIKEIVRLQFRYIQNMLEDKGIEIELGDSAVDYLVKVGYDPVFGARSLKRLIQKDVVNELAKEIIAGNLSGGTTVYVESDGDKIVFKQK
jgi:ATP-dependent Clp protease ATP-binding subunit ClpB